jgi:hypothetical protein
MAARPVASPISAGQTSNGARIVGHLPAIGRLRAGIGVQSGLCRKPIRRDHPETRRTPPLRFHRNSYAETTRLPHRRKVDSQSVQDPHPINRVEPRWVGRCTHPRSVRRHFGPFIEYVDDRLPDVIAAQEFMSDESPG